MSEKRTQSAGLTVKQWLDGMRGWPVDKVRAVANDPAAPVAAAAAARAWLSASADQVDGGKPIPLATLQAETATTEGEGLTFVFKVVTEEDHRRRMAAAATRN